MNFNLLKRAKILWPEIPWVSLGQTFQLKSFFVFFFCLKHTKCVTECRRRDIDLWIIKSIWCAVQPVLSTGCQSPLSGSILGFPVCICQQWLTTVSPFNPAAAVGACRSEGQIEELQDGTCVRDIREGVSTRRKWRSRCGSDGPPIGLRLSLIRGGLPTQTWRSIVINTPHCVFSLSHSLFSFVALQVDGGGVNSGDGAWGGGVWRCIECQKKTNASVYLWDISSNILPARTQTHAHTLSNIPLIDSEQGVRGVRGYNVLYSRADGEGRIVWIHEVWHVTENKK